MPGIVIPTMGDSHIEKSAQATLAALDQAGVLQPRHALTCQLVLELARAVGTGLTFGKVTIATATLAKQLMEAIDTLPTEALDQDGDDWDQLAADLRAAAQTSGSQ